MIKDGWFMEKGDMWPGQAMCLEVEEVLEQCTSKFQEVLIFKSKSYGNVLVLDGVIQCTERDEFAYQEMIAHLPLYSHPNPEKVLIVGGGDGGVLREVLKHPSVKKVVQCEIDEMVVEMAKKYLPNMSSSYSDERCDLVIEHGVEFLKHHKSEFDVIITDSSDPIGPAKQLFEMPYYEAMHASLKPGGRIYAVVEYAYTSIPTYPSGQIGFILCAKSEATKFREPLRSPSEKELSDLRYYNSEIHSAAFVLPNFARRSLLS